jgi:hypothetical protein
VRGADSAASDEKRESFMPYSSRHATRQSQEHRELGQGRGRWGLIFGGGRWEGCNPGRGWEAVVILAEDGRVLIFII